MTAAAGDGGQPAPISVELREITKDTVREVCALEVRNDQKGYVAANALSIAQAHFEPTAVFRAIYLGEQPIGFVQWRDGGTPGTVVLWRFMIDRRHQSAGLGRTALALVLLQMRRSGFETVETSVVRGPSGPLDFYLSQGFVEVGQATPRGEWLLSKAL
ncbi:GNAT family N-acetyltransferase [Bosea sp. F3-2]|uniref:GNAT family N-acetyltransferase n=1 Tax=Bosea sp. F3-2 TaxID=2599640 RepID=UPI0016564D02|nr:GNAT family N-acetyltransferase [Bosea sp. F3-2]